MKKVMVALLTLMLVLPIGVMAKKDTNTGYEGYNTLNLQETLAAEDIELEYEDYVETSKQITIYMFRGQGCGYCKKFLNFLNSITEEYGQYFKLVSFEVWQDEANGALMNQVAEKLGEEASGVPYIIIGNKTFPGYSEEYDDQIKEAILNLYNTKKADRFDVFSGMEKEKNNNDIFVGIGAAVVVVGIVAAAIITRRNNA